MISDNIISAYGEVISWGSSSAKGFISPIDSKNPEKKHIPLPAGVANEARYLLITNINIAEGGSVVTHGEEYEVLRTEPIYFAGAVSHYECILRPKGRLSDV